jgi:hypothetical protein
METINKIPKNVDELVALMLERKKERKIENEKKYNSQEFQEFLMKLRALKDNKQ